MSSKIKVCKKCNRDELSVKFYSYRNHICSECEIARHIKWQKDNPKRHYQNIRKWKLNNPEKELAWRLRKVYKFEESVVLKILSWDGGECASCGRKLDKIGRGVSGACIHHNHESGEFIDLLCNSCNIILGHVREDENILFKLIEYIRRKHESD